MKEPDDDTTAVPVAEAWRATLVPLARPVSAAPASAPPWGFWATLLWSVLVLGATLVIQVALIPVAMAVAKGPNPQIDIQQFTLDLAEKGWFLSLSILVGTPVALALIALVVRLRRCPLADYLGLTRPAPGLLLKAVLGVVGFIVLSDLLAWLAGRPVVPPFMVNAYRTAGFLPLLVLAVCLAGPLMEESLFRGFMFQGIVASRAGAAAAVLITSVSWAALHIQYDWVGISTILAGGILLGILRIRSRSMLPCLLCHVVVNLVATVETAIVVGRTGN